jgi:DNA-binding NtrC family response regulator
LNTRTPSLSFLVVDDVEEILAVVAQWLRAKGHEVECAATGRDAIEFTRRRAFDMAIVDVLMPECDGLDVLKAIKATRPKTSVLVISGGGHYMTGPDCLKLALGMGAHGALMKPFTEAQLIEAINGAWQAKRAAENMSTSTT